MGRITGDRGDGAPLGLPRAHTTSMVLSVGTENLKLLSYGFQTGICVPREGGRGHFELSSVCLNVWGNCGPLNASQIKRGYCLGTGDVECPVALGVVIVWEPFCWFIIHKLGGHDQYLVAIVRITEDT